MSATPVTKDALKDRLQHGQANGKSVKTLASELDTTERAVRQLREELVDDGVPVCAHPLHGYFIATTHEEVNVNYEWLRSRGLHELSLASRLRAAFAKSTGLDQVAEEEISAL